MSEFDKLMEIRRETEDFLSSTVKISHNEVLKLVISDLIAKRNCSANKIVESFDNVLKYYIGDEDFQKYVINGEKVS